MGVLFIAGKVHENPSQEWYLTEFSEHLKILCKITFNLQTALTWYATFLFSVVPFIRNKLF